MSRLIPFAVIGVKCFHNPGGGRGRAKNKAGGCEARGSCGHLVIYEAKLPFDNLHLAGRVRGEKEKEGGGRATRREATRRYEPRKKGRTQEPGGEDRKKWGENPWPPLLRFQLWNSTCTELATGLK